MADTPAEKAIQASVKGDWKEAAKQFVEACYQEPDETRAYHYLVLASACANNARLNGKLRFG